MTNLKINFNKSVWEGWTVGNIIAELAPQITQIMCGESFREPFRTKAELAAWCKDNQPYYKRKVAGVNNYFAQKYNLK